MIKRLLLSSLAFLIPLSAFATWSTDRDASAGYVTVTTQASVIDEAVPFFIVYLSDLPSGFHSAMDAASDTDGKTIRLSTSDGSTQLALYPVGINTSTDTGALFCLGTGMSASVDVSYRIYVGNAALSMESVSGGYGRNTVFAAYAGFYLPGMSLTDLTGGGRTLTAVASPGTGTSSVEGITAATYNLSTQYHSYSGTQGVTNFPLSIESLAYSQYDEYNQAIVLLDNTGGGSQNVARLMFAGGTAGDYIQGRMQGSTGSASISSSTAAYSENTWYYCATTRSGTTTGTSTTYINGANGGTDSTTLGSAPTFDRMRIGMGASIELGGRVAMAALSSSARSADFIATMYDNWNGDLYSVGSWTPNSVAPGTTGWVLFQTAATTSASGTLVDWTNVNNALVDDATYATAALDNGGNYESEYLNLTNPAYGVTVPTGAPSYTVEFRIKRSRDTGGGHRIDDLTVQFIDDTSTRVGSNLALTANWPTTAATQDYTLAGYTPDGTEFTSAAGLAIRATAINAAGLSNAQVLVAWIKVSWTGTDTTGKTRGFFALAE